MGIAYQLLDGYGGVILRLGFVNYLSKNYKNVLIIMYKYHENTVTYMLKHLTRWTFKMSPLFNIYYIYIIYIYGKNKTIIFRM